jgi:ribosomal protein L11 methyltransferase
MNQYWKYEILNVSEEQSAVLIAALTDMGLEGFEEVTDQLIAFGKVSEINHAAVEEILNNRGIPFVRSVIAEQNWNALWESNFDPVEVDQFVHIRADFHEAKQGFDYEILITPKMSFGTGHHATTYSMMKKMKGIDFAGKTVCDYGTGTGVLAILAEKLGAVSILAIDNDNWSIENSIENIQRNNCKAVSIQKAETIVTDKLFDIVLANINRNILLDNMQAIANAAKPNADILLSGFYEEDIPALAEAAAKYGMLVTDDIIRNKWVCLHLKKQTA